MFLLQEAMIGGPILILVAFIGFIILGMLYYFLYKSTKGDPGSISEEKSQKDIENRQVKRDTVSILIFMVLITITVLFVSWLCNFKFD